MGLAIAASALVVAVVHGALDWPLVGFIVTCTYLLTIAAQFTLADTAGPRRGRRKTAPETPTGVVRTARQKATAAPSAASASIAAA